MKRAQLARADAGFTLIEMLIAITIFALLMIAVYQTFDQSFRAYKTVERSRDLNETARLVLDRIQDDLQSAVVFPGNPFMVFEGKDGTTGNGQPADSLVFTTLNHLALNPAAPESDQAEIEYRIATDNRTQQRYLMRREKAYLDDDHEQGGVSAPLSGQITGLNFRYFDGSEDLKERWDGTDLGEQLAHDRGLNVDDGVNTTVLPQAVETTLILTDADGRDVAFSSVTRLVLAPPPPNEEITLPQ